MSKISNTATIILALFGLSLSSSALGQSKKNQIQILNYQIDSLEQVIMNDRSNNIIKLEIKESEFLALKTSFTIKEEELYKVKKDLDKVNEKFFLEKKEFSKLKEEFQDINEHLIKYRRQYESLESSFIYGVFGNEIEKIQKTYHGQISVQEIYFGDLTGDRNEEIIFYYVLTSDYGGNSSAGTGLVIYQMEKNEIKVYGTYENNRLFSFDKVFNGDIYIDFLELAEGDANCCPSIKRNKKLEVGKDIFYY